MIIWNYLVPRSDGRYLITLFKSIAFVFLCTLRSAEIYCTVLSSNFDLRVEVKIGLKTKPQ